MSEKIRPTVLITGASAGIGAALAREYARYGYHLILVARRLERLELLATELRAPDRKVLVYSADVTRLEDMKNVVELALAQLPSLDIAIANAGFGVAGEFEKLSNEDYARQFETNIYGVLNTLRVALPALKKSRGRVGIVGSVMGYLSVPGNSPYAMSKFAIRAFADSVRHELRSQGVSVTHISPGIIRTEIRRVNNEGRFLEEAQDPAPAWISASPEYAARVIRRALQWRVRERCITFHGWLIIRLLRHFPGVSHWLISHLGVRARAEPG